MSQRGTDDSPLVVRVQPVARSKADSVEDLRERDAKLANDRDTLAINHNLVIIGVLQLIVFVGQLIVFWYQATKLRQTVDASAENSRDMKASIAQATRAAAAMEIVATNAAISATVSTENAATIRARTAQQMRAYLSVIIGTGVYQEREKGFRFEAKPTMLNAGTTPAHDVGYRAKAAVLPVPLPEDFDFPLPEEAIGAAVLGPHQNFLMSAIVDDYCDDAVVDDVKKGRGSALYVWGIVTYKDVFTEKRETRFCHQIVWLDNNQIWGFYTARFNVAD